MDIHREVLFFFSALGAFNGLVLSAYFLFFTKKKHLSNYFLGALLLSLSIRVGKSVLIYFNHDLPRVYLQIGLSACFFIGPFLYYFFKSSLSPENRISNSWKPVLLLLFIFIAAAGILYPFQQYPWFWNHRMVNLIYFEWLLYVLASAFLLRGIFKRSFSRKNPLKTSEIWLLAIFLGNLLIMISYFLTFAGFRSYPYIMSCIVFSLILYLVISILLYRKKTDDLFAFGQVKYVGKRLSDTEAALLIKKLESLMQGQELYKNPDLKLNELSKSIHVSAHQLSQLLNDNMGKNFTTFVNEFRINEACQIIASDDRLTLEAIGYEVGFNSKSTFFAAFKKQTGTTPLSYQQNALKVVPAGTNL
ncbi:helix-turn-helix domain-containing protein [Pedobacter nutrimenti]|jgi:AraC-like DNA-binding protein|uniref:Helix-turn-helix protein n=1 Tax=Pedobacter nutrimenti TaxID=1241337 RepID=A0A318UEW3_9SPHI|nr:helix-turn-helix domain-containing protein [Pedobacter nutrimenti]PYF74964.1 helix-turn-helix protein [Pedobacter nutrimenti]